MEDLCKPRVMVTAVDCFYAYGWVLRFCSLRDEPPVKIGRRCSLGRGAAVVLIDHSDLRLSCKAHQSRTPEVGTGAE